MFPLLFLLLPLFPSTFPQNLCSDEGVCCSRRSNDCVVQKVLSNHSLDVSHKPCYCDQACQAMADCCQDYHQFCRHQGKTRHIHRTSITDRKISNGTTFSRTSCLEMIVIRSSLSCTLLPQPLRAGSSICVLCRDCEALLTHTVHKFRIHRHCHGKIAVSLPSHGGNIGTLDTAGYEVVVTRKKEVEVMEKQEDETGRDDSDITRRSDDVEIDDSVMTGQKDEIGRDGSAWAKHRDDNEKDDVTERNLMMTAAAKNDDCSCNHERQFIVL